METDSSPFIYKPVLTSSISTQNLEEYETSKEINRKFKALEKQTNKLFFDLTSGYQNQHKNIYIDILPQEHSLIKGEGYPIDFYINANRVTLLSQSYIIMQGPLEKTIHDFWLTLINENCSLVLNLAKHQEQGFIKYTKYWCKDSLFTANWQIQLKDKSFLSTDHTLVQRTFEITNCENLTKRSIIQIHKKDWPDHNAITPSELDHLLDLIIEKKAAQQAECVAIHCSAGVGRSGTLATVLALKHKLLQTQKPYSSTSLQTLLDETILSGREQRHKQFVKELTQYQLLYNWCLKNCLPPFSSP